MQNIAIKMYLILKDQNPKNIKFKNLWSTKYFKLKMKYYTRTERTTHFLRQKFKKNNVCKKFLIDIKPSIPTMYKKFKIGNIIS